MAEYVDSLMTEKGLDAVQVSKKSGGRISANHVRKIRRGLTLNPSIPMLQNLATGMDEDPTELLKYAGVKAEQPENPWPAPMLVRAMQKIISDPDFTAIVKELMQLDTKGLKKIRRAVCQQANRDN
ncbi:MAG: hypothetical protein ACREDR_29735 [Blastocatellia bacterium]